MAEPNDDYGSEGPYEPYGSLVASEFVEFNEERLPEIEEMPPLAGAVSTGTYETRVEAKVLVVDLTGAEEGGGSDDKNYQLYVELLERKDVIIIATGFLNTDEPLTLEVLLGHIKKKEPSWYNEGGEYEEVYTEHDLDIAGKFAFIVEKEGVEKRPVNFQWPILISSRWEYPFSWYYHAVKFPDCISHGGLCLLSQVRFLAADSWFGATNVCISL
jgi:hypothetical protein